MKLIDILVEELPKRGGWPDDSDEMSQSQFDCEIYTESKFLPDFYVGERAEDNGIDNGVTRDQYEAALAAKNDGWIEWGGGECPVEKGTLVDVRYRNGKENHHVGAGLSFCDTGSNPDLNAEDWSKDGTSSDIIAYRLHQPAKSERVRTDAWNAYAGIDKVNDETDLNECIGQNPVTTWNGEGLPPAGCECEVMQENPLSVFGDWTQCKVINFNHRDGKESQVCIIDYNGDFAILYANDGYKFRPVRSEAERKRDIAAGKIFDVICKSLTDDSESTSFAIYDAIAAGEITGVKLED